MSAERNKEDQALLTALDRLDSSRPTHWASPEDDAPDPALVREYTELLGLLVYELEPETPRPELWQQILGAVRSMEAGAPEEVAAEGLPADEGSTWSERAPKRPVADLTLVQSAPRRDVEEMTLHQPPAAEAGEAAVDMTLMKSPMKSPAGHSPPPPPEPLPFRAAIRETAVRTDAGRPPARSGWVSFALAAMLGVCLLGLGFFAGKLDEQSTTIVRLKENIGDLQSERDQLLEIKGHLEMVNAVARHVYRMQPVAAAQQTSAKGIVYVCGRHKQWYLHIEGLEPAPAGHEYHLWFKTPEGMENGGTVEVRQDAPYEVESQSLPPGTRGFAVTLEKTGTHIGIQGQYVLVGEKSVSL
ncbi:MAG: anti-sigma factor [bacterium]|nr:anti-sigma factor [bacterium]